MFEFGRELKRILGTDVDHDELEPSLLELLDADMLAVQARAQMVDAGRVSTRCRHDGPDQGSVVRRDPQGPTTHGGR